MRDRFPAMAKAHYSDYLALEKILDAQRPLTSAHDEHLFIVIHQAYELWFKQIYFELDSVRREFATPSMSNDAWVRINSRLYRVTKIVDLLVQQVGVLETMTPMDFLEFRDALYPASGFQSVQFRMVENLLGLKRDDRERFEGRPYTSVLKDEERIKLEKQEEQQSLSDVVDAWLQRAPFLSAKSFQFWQVYQNAVDESLTQDAKARPHSQTGLNELKDAFAVLFDAAAFDEAAKTQAWRFSQRALQAALFIQLYRDEPLLQAPFRFLELLIDLDEGLYLWRSRHAVLAHRMIGAKMGTGGSSGAKYLASAAQKHRVFSDFVNLATFLLPRSKLPKLPEEVEKILRF